MTNTESVVRNLIASGDTEKAIKVLIKLKSSFDETTQNQIDLLSGRYSHWKNNNVIKGVQGDEYELRKIANATIELVSSVEDKPIDGKKELVLNSMALKVSAAIGVLLLIMVLIKFIIPDALSRNSPNYFHNRKPDENLVDSFNNEKKYEERSTVKIDEKTKIQILELYSDDELWRYINDSISHINELWIAGAHLQYGYGKIRNSIEHLIANKKKVRVVITNPKSDCVKVLAQRKEPEHSPTMIKESIESTLKNISNLMLSFRQENLINFEVHLIDFPLDERIHVINPGDSDSRIYIKSYPYKAEEGVAFGGLYFLIRKNDSGLYNFYIEKYSNYFFNSVKFN